MEFIHYFSEVFTFTNMMILIFGTIGGLLLGATPRAQPDHGGCVAYPIHLSNAAHPRPHHVRRSLYRDGRRRRGQRHPH